MHYLFASSRPVSRESLATQVVRLRTATQPMSASLCISVDGRLPPQWTESDKLPPWLNNQIVHVYPTNESVDRSTRAQMHTFNQTEGMVGAEKEHEAETEPNPSDSLGRRLKEVCKSLEAQA